MGRKRDPEKRESLVAIFAGNPKTRIRDAARLCLCSAEYAGQVKKECLGGAPPLQRGARPWYRKKTRHQGTIKVRCLGYGPEHWLESEFREVGDRHIPLTRICHRCAAERVQACGSGMFD